MRDPERIDEILELVREHWKENPDLRLMQLLMNLMPRKGIAAEVYYFDDDKIREALIALRSSEE